jgi:LPS O-antigen subunit length determinant protein (WzzB/FepE family)
VNLEIERDSEIDLRHLARRLVRGWRIILLTTVVALIIGGTLYFTVPRSYQATVKVLPITQTRYADYADLIAKSAVPDALQDPQKNNASLNVFPYTRDDLFNEFIAYLQSPEHLIRAAQASGVVRSEDGKQPADEKAALAFVRTVSFSQPTDRDPGFEMRARSSNEPALDKFVAWSLANARIEAAKGIRASVISRIEAGEKTSKDAIAALTVDIASRRKQADDARKDEIERLGEQARIASTLNIVDPVTVQTLSPNPQQASAISAQAIDGDQPMYFQGSAALNKQINLLRNRKDNDPYTANLRDLQRQVYALENDNRAQTLKALLDESPLGKPATAPLARYSLVAATAQRVFPRPSIFGIGSLLIGLVIGAGIVLLRTEAGEGDPVGKSVAKG